MSVQSSFDTVFPNAEQFAQRNLILAHIAHALGAYKVPESWDRIQELVRAGCASACFSAGDPIEVLVDDEICLYDVLGIDEDAPVSNVTNHALSLQAHSPMKNICFDPEQYLFAVTEEVCEHFGWPISGDNAGMPPGCYSITLDLGAYRAVVAEDGTYCFITTQTVPIGGGIRHTTIGVDRGSNDSSYAKSYVLNGKFKAYSSDTFTVLENNDALDTYEQVSISASGITNAVVDMSVFAEAVNHVQGKHEVVYDAVRENWTLDSRTGYSLQSLGITVTGTPQDIDLISIYVGTSLGVATSSDPALKSEYVNFTPRQAYGSNRWSTSYLRQYLNSDDAVLDWKPATPFSRRPATLPEGFLHQLDPELRNVLGKVRKRYALSLPDGYGFEDVDDFVTLVTMFDLYGLSNGPDGALIRETAVDLDGNEIRDTSYSLWKDTSDADKIKYRGNEALSWWQSSVGHAGGSLVKYVDRDSGSNSSNYANQSIWCAPSIHIV